MTCSYCGTRNGEGEQRCRCCGRKPGDTLTGEFPMPRVEGALAAQPQPMLRPPVARPPEPSQVNLRAATQRALPFGDRSSKVIAFDSFVATPVKKSVPSQTRAGSGTAAAAAPARTPSRRAPRVSPDQGSLDFLPAVQAKPRTLGTSVEAVIYCDAPVATTLHRAVAAGLDASMVFIGYGLFLLAFYLFGGEFYVSRLTLPIFGGAFLMVAFVYGFFFALAGGETAGMRWTHLRLITFDGSQPERKQRLVRFASSCLSVCTVLGLLWSLVDEECLGWHDHMSGTFPTPAALESIAFRRR